MGASVESQGMIGSMRDRGQYSKLLGIEAPWTVRDVDVRLDAGDVAVFIEPTPALA